jgi:hypothetical protein
VDSEQSKIESPSDLLPKRRHEDQDSPQLFAERVWRAVAGDLEATIDKVVKHQKKRATGPFFRFKESNR